MPTAALGHGNALQGHAPRRSPVAMFYPKRCDEPAGLARPLQRARAHGREQGGRRARDLLRTWSLPQCPGKLFSLPLHFPYCADRARSLCLWGGQDGPPETRGKDMVVSDAKTAEDFRKEVITELERREAIARKDSKVARLLVQRIAAGTTANELRDVRLFLESIVIAPEFVAAQKR